MYHVSIGQYRINENETLPTMGLNESYEILFDSDKNELHSLLIVDEGSIGIHKQKKKEDTPYIHLFLTNIRDGEANVGQE